MNEEQILKCAEVCHAANAAYCRTLGDTSQLSWHRAPDWQRESAINGVKFILDNPRSTPEKSHENWLKEKVEDGWTYGEVKDPEAKTHPCIMPYKDLPEEQKLKDHIFSSIVKGFISATSPTTKSPTPKKAKG